MHYAIFCYHSEETIATWSREHDDRVMTNLAAVQERVAQSGRLGPVAKLRPTATAKTLRKDREPHFVTDGPFAETKEAILGFYVVDCDTEAEALEIARQLGEVNPGGAYEVRPIEMYFPAGTGAPILA